MNYVNYLLKIEFDSLIERTNPSNKLELKQLLYQAFDESNPITPSDLKRIDQLVPAPITFLDTVLFSIPVNLSSNVEIHNKYDKSRTCELSPIQFSVFVNIIEAEITEDWNRYNFLRNYFREHLNDNYEYLTLID